jgi:hypothetical protein
LVNMFGLMEEYTMENGLIIKWKDKVLLLGVTDVNTLASIKMTKSMEKEHLSGLMDVNI